MQLLILLFLYDIKHWILISMKSLSFLLLTVFTADL